MKFLIASVLLAFALGARAEEAKKDYPLITCVVSGEALGEHGDPFIYKYKGREVQFCCKDCLRDFEKNPAKYLAMLDEAQRKAEAGQKVELKHEGHHHETVPAPKE